MFGDGFAGAHPAFPLPLMFDQICLSGITDPVRVHSLVECCEDNSTRRHVFLVTQTQDGIDVPIMCLVTLETSSHAYIQYVDTTGLLAPRSRQSQLTKEIIRAYINQRGFGICPIVCLCINELIFKGSSKIPHKRSLSAAQLIDWWIKCLEPFRTHAYIYSPFEERSGSGRLCRMARHVLEVWISMAPRFALFCDPDICNPG